MIKINITSTLFVGIDVSLKSNVVDVMDFDKNKFISSPFANNQPDAEELVDLLICCLNKHPNLNTIVVALESTSVYSIHIANYLSSCEELMRYKTYVNCLNPKMTANYRKSFIGLSKTDPIDAFILADFARVGRIETTPWRGCQYLALQRLTRHRLHLIESVTREKTYMVSNLYLKFSELQMLDKKEQPFSDSYGATSSSVLTEFYSPEEDLLAFIATKSRNRICDISQTAELFKSACKEFIPAG